jgi:hypothetical protein
MDYLYAAGAMDSDGHITIRCAKKRTYVVHIGFTNCYKPLVDEFQKTFGGSVHFANQAVRKASHRPTWVWVITNQQGTDFLHKILPHLIVKKEQAKLCIQLQERIDNYKTTVKKLGRAKDGETPRLYLSDEELDARKQLHDKCVVLKHQSFFPD